MAYNMSIVDYLTRQNIKFQPIKFGDTAKAPIKMGSAAKPYTPKITDFYNFKGTGVPIPDTELQERLKYLDECEYIAIDTTQIQQIDIDDPTTDFRMEAPHYLSMTKKLPHYFVFLDSPNECKNKTCLKNDDGTCNDKLEVLNGQWGYAHKDTMIDASFDIPTLSTDKVVKANERRKTKLTKKEQSEKSASDASSNNGEGHNAEHLELNYSKDDCIEYETLEKIVMNLNKTRAESYNDWVRTIWATWNVGQSNDIQKELVSELIHSFSKQSTKYNARDTEYKMKQQNADTPYLTIGSLLWMLREDNPDIYYDIFAHLTTPEDKNRPPYRVVKAKFEQYVAKISHPPQYVHWDGENEYIYKATEAKETWCDFERYWIPNPLNPSVLISQKFITYWMDDQYKRRYRAIGFLPTPLKCPITTYNTWKGFDIDIQAKQKKLIKHTNFDELPAVQRFKQLLLVDICNNDKKVYEYITCYIAQMYQCPASHLRKAILIKGKQGTGKNCLTKCLSAMIGKKHSHSSANPKGDYFGNFNAQMRDKIMITIDETNGQDTSMFADMLKHFIDTTSINTNEKYQQKRDSNNYIRLWFCTNNNFPIKVEMTDRRYIVLETSEEHLGRNPENNDYWADMHEYLGEDTDSQNLYDIYNYLLSVDIDNWDHTQRPITEAYSDLRRFCMDPVYKYLCDITGMAFARTKQPKKFRMGTYNDVLSSLKEWLQSNNYSQNKLPNRDQLKISFSEFRDNEVYYDQGYWVLVPTKMKRWFENQKLWDNKEYAFIEEEEDEYKDHNPDL